MYRSLDFQLMEILFHTLDGMSVTPGEGWEHAGNQEGSVLHEITRSLGDCLLYTI